MTKLVGFLVITFIALLAYLAILNQGVVSLKLSEKHIYEIPKIALILFSVVIGSLAMLAIGVVRDARRYIESLQHLRQHKKELKTQEYYSKGLDAFFASRYDEATEFFNRVIESDSSNVNALLRRGDIAFDKGDLVGARDFYIKAKEIRPQSVETLFSLEKVFESERKWQEALRYLDNILDIDAENPKALYRKRGICETNKDWEAMIDIQHRLLKSDITHEEREKEHKNLLGYKYELGRYYLEKGEIDKAKKALKTIIKLDKDFSAAYLAMAESFLSEGDAEEAENILMKGYQTTSAVLVFLVRLEDFFISAGEPGRIIDLYQKAIQAKPGDASLQFFLAKLYFRLEMIDYAYETIMGIDTTAADFPDLHILLGDVYERHNEYDKAAGEFRKALNAERPFLVPFCCSHCSYTLKDWIGRCPGCNEWNTLALDISGTCKI